MAVDRAARTCSASPVRILVDYRPALRQRTGVGEYIHNLVGALARVSPADDITIFSSSWRDRLDGSPFRGVRVVDRRVPVRLLNFLWHRLEIPSIELLARRPVDVVHSPHPLLLPARRAAQFVTIHDLHFLTHPERSAREIRRDYPGLVASHARRADRVVVSSRFAADEVEQRLSVPRTRIVLCPAGAPPWPPRRERPARGYILFLGTLEARKNIHGLLRAYACLIERRPDAPDLVLAGSATPETARWLEELRRPPLAGHARHLGYIAPEARRQVYEQALVLVLPSFEEGFGLTALEAMTVGVPIVASARGSLPEVVGDAGLLVEPEEEALADALERMVYDRRGAEEAAARAVARSRLFNWEASARILRQAYADAVASRDER